MAYVLPSLHQLGSFPPCAPEPPPLSPSAHSDQDDHNDMETQSAEVAPSKRYVIWSVETTLEMLEPKRWKLWAVTENRRLAIDAMRMLRAEQAAYLRTTEDKEMQDFGSPEAAPMRHFFVTHDNMTRIYHYRFRCTGGKTLFRGVVIGKLGMKRLRNSVRTNNEITNVKLSFRKRHAIPLRETVETLLTQGKQECHNPVLNPLHTLAHMAQRFKDLPVPVPLSPADIYTFVLAQEMVRVQLDMSHYDFVHPPCERRKIMRVAYSLAQEEARMAEDKTVESMLT